MRRFSGGLVGKRTPGAVAPWAALVAPALLAVAAAPAGATIAATRDPATKPTKPKVLKATVRGTIWLTQDRCDGTLTTVKRGTVSVRDFKRRRTVSVKAGHSYLARAASKPKGAK